MALNFNNCVAELGDRQEAIGSNMLPDMINAV